MDKLASIMELIYQKISIGEQGKSMIQDLYKCAKCKDTGFVYDSSTNLASRCECQEKEKYQRILDSCGISEQFRKIGFKEFETNTEYQKNAKSLAVDYTKNFLEIEKQRNNSIAFLGNCGSGKTHLSIAIANNLMTKNIAVLYMPYRETITKIKQIVTDEIEYNRLMGRYKRARVLLIDDFAKGKTTESDVNIMFEIVNFRYLNNLPIIMSSELTQEKLLEFDEAVGSRLIEMCRKRTIQANGIENNYRLRR